MFKTELHCHSSEVSECARVTADDIVSKYTEAGYKTLVLANHLSKTTMRYLKCESWQELVERFWAGYELLKEKAEGKLIVLPGAELRFTENSNDYLLFGITKEFLLQHENMLELNPEIQ